MNKFYRELPKEITDILMISKGWLVGSSIGDILDKKVPRDYDIIVSPENYSAIYRHVSRYDPEFNNHGGLKIRMYEDLESDNYIEVDLWIQSLDSFLTRAATVLVMLITLVLI